MKHKIKYMGILVFFVFILILGIGSRSSDEGVSDNLDRKVIKEAIQGPGIRQKITVPPLKARYTFSGEIIPIENRDVRERLQRELIVNTYYHSSTILNLLRSRRYFAEIDVILRKKGIPTDFKYVAVAESNLEYVTSPAGARGIWQLMPSVAKHYGLEVNSSIDERNHFEKSTYAACALISDYYKRFGGWILTAAAYNAGETRVARNMESQQAETYFDLNLSAETNRYMFRILALKEILENPEEYGFYIDESDYYDSLTGYDLVTIDETINDLGEFAAEQGISYRALKLYNPWLLTQELPNRSRKVYEIKIPREFKIKK